MLVASISNATPPYDDIKKFNKKILQLQISDTFIGITKTADEYQ
jgi:hypothetical protein